MPLTNLRSKLKAIPSIRGPRAHTVYTQLYGYGVWHTALGFGIEKSLFFFHQGCPFACIDNVTMSHFLCYLSLPSTPANTCPLLWLVLPDGAQLHSYYILYMITTPAILYT